MGFKGRNMEIYIPTLTIAIDTSAADLIILGFQELDLSAGALLYSTETTREDAWTMAIMAGLGEKAELYEKVSLVSWPRLSTT